MSKRWIRVSAALVSLAVVAAACGGTEEATEAPASAAPAAATPTAAATTAAATPTSTLAATATPGPSVASVANSALVSASTASSSTVGEPVPAPDLVDLVMPDGSAFDLASLQGENVLLFFGYTHCPDVCPQTIGELFGVFEALPQTQAVFVSVDPERDTPEFLQEWLSYKPENLHAVTGSPGAIRRAADNYGVKYARVETTSTAGYTMSHTADIYLIDADGQYLLAYPFGTPAAEIVADLKALDAS